MSMSPDHNMTFWRDVPVWIKEKQHHITWKDYRKNSKQRRSGRYSFIVTLAEMPSCQYNTITKRTEAIDNPRGKAYATRKRLMFRKSKKEKLYEIHKIPKNYLTNPTLYIIVNFY